ADYLALAETGDLTVRIWQGATGVGDDLASLAQVKTDVATRVPATRGPLLEVGFVKLMADGVLSAHTAALLEPYSDRPDERGLPRMTASTLSAAVRTANQAGFPVAVHAIGDRAVRMALDAFEAAADAGVLPDWPNRIEHVEVVSPEDAPRFAQLGVLASFNPHHCITGIDVYNTERLGPERAPWSFAWGRLRDQGASLVLGSDWATAPLDPLRQLYAATLREKPSGGPEGGWHPDNTLTWREALTAYTLAPAEASGWDSEVGSLSVGKWADFVVLDGAIPEPMDRTLLDRQVRATYLAGEAVFQQ
ncbi:MAG: amidohydrolase family protein, partial [Gemmatimonadota bacterium]|nr:amidohydrolase family protein [Gemmatimonadota bacterium]